MGVLRALAVVLAVAGLSPAANASLPVPFAVVGCIKDGRFQSRELVTPVLANPAFRTLEGKTVRVEGDLSPGDRFLAKALFLVDETCQASLHNRYMLCDPCRTLPNMPHKSRPPRETGRPINLPPAAIQELHNFGRR